MFQPVLLSNSMDHKIELKSGREGCVRSQSSASAGKNASKKQGTDVLFFPHMYI